MNSTTRGDKGEAAPLPPLDPRSLRIAIIGLGYVGLPLATALGSRYETRGFDLNSHRIEKLKSGIDTTGEISANDLATADRLQFSSDPACLEGCDVFIVTVPTPIDASRHPNLGPLISASRLVGGAITPGGVVIYESTVYPGATEEDCLPVVEQVSGLTLNADFFAGYSPERINPGDRDRPLTKIVKVTSGSNPQTADFVDALYASIIEAGTFKASSIKVAEAAKIIENTQRDVNIALINELSIIFSHLGIDTKDVLDAAGTKWNFIKFQPGLVGGHCIGVDPYYLLHKSMSAGYIPDIIRSAREINDGMARNAASRLIKLMIARDLPIKGARVLVVGFTFKENCPDTRNTKVIEFVNILSDYGMGVEVVDSWADPTAVARDFGLTISRAVPQSGDYHSVVLAVPHKDLVSDSTDLRSLLTPGGVVFDMKAALPIANSDLRL
jgi:UDP-N-acetyl-D-galactosamine dehydrogenase